MARPTACVQSHKTIQFQQFQHLLCQRPSCLGTSSKEQACLQHKQSGNHTTVLDALVNETFSAKTSLIPPWIVRVPPAEEVPLSSPSVPSFFKPLTARGEQKGGTPTFVSHFRLLHCPRLHIYRSAIYGIPPRALAFDWLSLRDACERGMVIMAAPRLALRLPLTPFDKKQRTHKGFTNSSSHVVSTTNSDRRN